MHIETGIIGRDTPASHGILKPIFSDWSHGLMRFEEAYEEWKRGRLMQEEAAREEDRCTFTRFSEVLYYPCIKVGQSLRQLVRP